VRLRYAPRARTDIAEIHQHIAQFSPRAAIAVTAQIRATSRLLAEYPGLGKEKDIPGIQVFSTARYPYLVYYTVRGSDLVVVHVRHARRDAPEAI
jgi:toxin ParE1/3/4